MRSYEFVWINHLWKYIRIGHEIALVVYLSTPSVYHWSGNQVAPPQVEAIGWLMSLGWAVWYIQTNSNVFKVTHSHRALTGIEEYILTSKKIYISRLKPAQATQAKLQKYVYTYNSLNFPVKMNTCVSKNINSFYFFSHKLWLQRQIIDRCWMQYYIMTSKHFYLSAWFVD